MTFKRPLLTFSLSLLSMWILAAIPAGYYSTATGTGATLKTQLYQIINGHSASSYGDLWTDFQTTDKKSNGKVWDMYSDIPNGTPPYEYTFGSNQCGNYSGENSCYNREHSFPKSWFNDATPMYSDLFHLYPTDGYVNGQRGNYPFGEVSNATWTSQNGSKKGSNSYPGYSGTVFEPIDAYKGDFARTYFYMATRYENVIAGWENNESNADAILDGTSFPVYETWFLNMLAEWHANDPVSDKETARNDAVYGIQGNRNPFIDHPEYVQSVWGVGTDEARPSIGNPTATNITATTAHVGGNITSTGSSNLIEAGIYYSTSNGFADGTGTKLTSTATTTGAFTVQITNLTPATTYYYKAFARNNAGTAYSTQGNFKTATASTGGNAVINVGNVINQGATLDFGTVSTVSTKHLIIKTAGLTGDLTVSSTGDMFSTSATSISKADAQNGYSLSITFTPTTAGTHTGTLTISGGGLTPEYQVNLTGTK